MAEKLNGVTMPIIEHLMALRKSNWEFDFWVQK